VPKAFAAVTVKVATPSAVDVPLMTPVEVFNVNPVGNEPAVTVQVIGVLPEAARV
jgi:hypothetical protein